MIGKRISFFFALCLMLFCFGCIKQDALYKMRDYFPDAQEIPTRSSIWHFETNASGIGEATARAVFKKFREESMQKQGAIGSSLARIVGPQLVIIGFREIEIQWIPGQEEAAYFSRMP